MNREENQTRYRFGNKLREIRERRGVTMKALGAEVGVSESLLSQIERDKVSPSLDTLIAITDALEIDLEYLFRDLKKQGSVSLVKKESRNSHTIEGVKYQHLSKITDQQQEHNIEALLLTIPPRHKKGNREYGHIGMEMGFIIQGKGELEYGNEKYLLEEGDSISFSSDIPHTLYNRGEDKLEALWIVTPPKI